MTAPPGNDGMFPTLQAVRAGTTRMRMLISYHYFKTRDLDKLIPQYFTEPYPEILMDSGAWSAFTQGATIKPQQYIDFIKRFKHWFVVYSNLDDMQNPEQTMKNQFAMEDAGLIPFPVFHTGEPWKFLEYYIDHYTYMALGKIIPYTSNHQTIIPWVTKCFRMAGDRTRFHGFGVTNWTLLKSFPWYSADSSSWGSGYRYGRVPIFDPTKGRFFGVNLGNVRSVYQYAHLIKDYGFEPGKPGLVRQAGEGKPPVAADDPTPQDQFRQYAVNQPKMEHHDSLFQPGPPPRLLPWWFVVIAAVVAGVLILIIPSV